MLRVYVDDGFCSKGHSAVDSNLKVSHLEATSTNAQAVLQMSVSCLVARPYKTSIVCIGVDYEWFTEFGQPL